MLAAGVGASIITTPGLLMPVRPTRIILPQTLGLKLTEEAYDAATNNYALWIGSGITMFDAEIYKATGLPKGILA